jgi:hypothetical protein
MRFNNANYRSLNESINQVQNPHAALNEAREYSAALEEILLALCEELEIDLDSLLEDLQTPEREQEMEKEGQRLRNKIARSKTVRQAENIRKVHNKQQAKLFKEKRAKTVYGKGGKPVRKGSEDYARAHAAKQAKDKQFKDSYRKWQAERGNAPEDEGLTWLARQ